MKFHQKGSNKQHAEVRHADKLEQILKDEPMTASLKKHPAVNLPPISTVSFISFKIPLIVQIIQTIYFTLSRKTYKYYLIYIKLEYKKYYYSHQIFECWSQCGQS